MITSEQVKELRNKTGISVMQCKRALEEAAGDQEKAIAILKKTSSAVALKKSERTAKDGAVALKANPQKTVLVTLHCETDFVAKNADFTSLLEKLTEIMLTEGPEKLKAEAKNLIDPIIQKTGEKIELGNLAEVSGKITGAYLHGNQKVGVIVSLEGGTEELAKDIAMQVAAMKPEYIFKEEIQEETKNTIREIFEKEVASLEKPEEIKKKMLEGKMDTYFKEKTLTEQVFIKNPAETIGQLLEKNKSKLKEVKYSFI